MIGGRNPSALRYLGIFMTLLPFSVYCRNHHGHEVRVPRVAEKPPPVVHHRRLVKDLLETRGYDPRVRPVNRHNVPINVTIRMNLYQIVDVNERSQHIVLYCWMTQMWEDEFMSWDPEEYDNIDNIVIPYENIWLPDTYLYNGLEMVRENSERWISVILSMDKEKNDRASVIFRHPALYKFTCNMDILYFPFDKQCCKMTFGSWMYDSSGIDFFALQKDIFQEDFTESEEWTVISFQSKKTLEHYSCCVIPFSHFYAFLLIQRKPLHFIVNLVIPTVIITLISFVGFFSPASTSGERSEKVNLGITTLLAMSILLLMVSDQMPTTSNFVPLIGWFYLSIILLISLATVMTSVIITVQKQGHFGRRVSPEVKSIFFNYVGPIFCMTTPPNLDGFCWKSDQPTCETLVISPSNGYGERSSLLQTTQLVTLNGGDGDMNIQKTPTSEKVVLFTDDSTLNDKHKLDTDKLLVKGMPLSQKWSNSSLRSRNHEDAVITQIDDHGDSNMNIQLRKIQRQLVQLNEYVRAKEEEEKVHAEWEWLAAILDRVLLVIFVTIVTTVTVLIIAIGFWAKQRVTCHAEGQTQQ